MNWKTMSPLTVLLIVIIAMVGTVGVIYAVGQLTIPGNGTIVVTQTALTFSPSTLAWDNIEWGGAAKSRTITITNNGGTATGPLLISSVMPTGLTLTYNAGALSPIPAFGTKEIIFTLVADVTSTPASFTHTVLIDWT